MDLLTNTLNPSKRLKEEFVSNLSGTSIAELTALSTIVPALVVLRQWSSFCPANAKLYNGEVAAKKDDHMISSPKKLRSYMRELSIDYFCVVLPILLIFTILSQWVYECMILLVLLVLCRMLTKRSSNLHSKQGSQHQSVRTTILSYRVLVVVTTCLCILAVDFNIFPRRYAKAETYGSGLMDLGVGSFVVANSLVSRQARNSMLLNWKATLRSVSPLVLLGFGRLVSTTAVDYQVHVSEYGVHWNFFFTLAAVFILTSLINIHPKYCGVVGLLILIGYQISLVYGLGEYLISNERAAGIISQNKEGLLSIFGYWGMYLIGVQLGYQIFFGNNLPKMSGSVQCARISVWILTVLFGFLTVILDSYVERVSRRTCNLAYVMLVFAQNFQTLSVLMLSDIIPAQKPLVLEDAFNQNMLGSFLLANVLTGLINLCVDTLSASPFVAFSILFGYSFMLSVVVGLVSYYGIRLKFW